MSNLKKLSSLYSYSIVIFFLYNIPFFQRFPGDIQISSLVLFVIGLIANLKRVVVSKYILAVLIPLLTIQVYVTHGGLRSIEAGVSLIMLLSLLKILEMRELRDYFLFVLISIILLVGHMLNTDSLWFTIYSLGALYFAFYSMIKVRFSHFGRAINIQSLKRILLLVIPFSFVLFFLFPRFPINSYLWGAPNTTASSGFADEISPGNISKLVQSDKDVFRAVINRNMSIQELYWRGVVFSKNFGMTWKKDEGRAYRSWRRGKKLFNYRVDFDTDQAGSIFTLESTGSVKMKSLGQVYHSVGGTYKAYSLAGKKIRYSATVYEAKIKRLKDREKYLKYPQTEVRLINYLKENYSNLSPSKIVNRFLNDLRKNGFRYTLNPGSYSGGEPLSEFFFERRAGFCEHYSSLTAFAFRVLGIPSRVIGGFHGGTYNDYGDYYLVKEKDAHAWVEIWIEGKGWVLVDPVEYVAPERIQLGARDYFQSLENQKEDALSFLKDSNSFVRDAILAFDLLYYDLNVFFLNYDKEQQSELLKKYFGKINVKKLLLICFVIVVINLVIVFLFFYIKRWPSKIDRQLLAVLRKIRQRSGLTYNRSLPLLVFCQELEGKIDNYEDVKSFFEYYNKISYSVYTSDELLKFNKLYKDIIRHA